MYFNPYYLTPRVFAKNACFGHFRDFRAKLAPIYSKRHLQNDSVPFCSTCAVFYDFQFLFGHAQKSKFRDDIFGRESDLRL